MKKFTLLLIIMFIGTFMIAQSQSLTIKQNKSKSTKISSQKTDLTFNNTKEVVLLETFDTWPPTDWTIIDGTESQGTQHWYGGAGYAAIAWDDDGDGTARPQDEWMITPEVTVPSDGGIFAFEFHSNPYWMVSPNNNADLLAKISTDGGTTWTELWNEDDYTWEYDVWTEVLLELDAYADQTVKFAIQYVGTDACWVYIDNVTVFSAYQYDVSLIDARVDFWPYYIDYGYSGFYGQIPFDQIDETGAPIYFSGILKNRGTENITPELTISVKDPSATEVFTGTVAVPNELVFDSNDTALIQDPYFVFDPATLGEYTFDFTASIPGQTDSDLQNNTMSYTTTVTENVYAHDYDNYTSDFSTCLYDGDFGDGDIIGVLYQFFKTTTINHVSFFLPETAEVGTSYIVHVMYEDETNGWTALTSSALTSITEDTELNVWYNSTFLDDLTIEVTPGEVYEVLAAIEYFTDNGTKKFFVGADDLAPTMGFETQMYFFLENTWYYYGGSKAPLIRLNVGEENSVASNFAQNDINMYPNPSTGIVTISNVEGATIEVINLMGQVVASIENANEINNIDLSKNAEGTYIVRIINGNEISTSKLNLVK